MPVPTSISQLSVTPSANSPGRENPSLIDDYLRTMFAFIRQLSDRNASGVPFSPVGGIAATNVQAALQELDTEKITSGHLQPYALLSTSPQFLGAVRGNGGGLGLGRITVTTSTATPTGGADGDIVLVY